jgi:hypothetical protein
MQQQIQSRQTAEALLSEAIVFFTRRRAKVSERSEQGFRFSLEESPEADAGRVTVTPAADGSSNVVVEAEGLGLMAIAEGYIRELRKQARDSGRQTRAGTGASVGSGFADLRQRMGMPEPPPERPARPAGPPRPVAERRPMPADQPPRPPREILAEPQREILAETPGVPQAAPLAAPQAETPGEPRADSQGAGGVPGRAADGAGGSDEVGQPRAFLGHDVAVATGPTPGHASLDSEAPSAEQMGGVPAPEDVTVRDASEPATPAPGASVPGRETPGPGPGEAAGEHAPPER